MYVCVHVNVKRISDDAENGSGTYSLARGREIDTTLDPAYNEFGYNEYPAITSRFLWIKIIDCDVKKAWLQRAPIYNEQFLLHFYYLFKWDPVYYLYFHSLASDSIRFNRKYIRSLFQPAL